MNRPTKESLFTDAPVSRRKVSDEVLERLAQVIESGMIPSGDPLPSERELMAVYSVGRPAVREALQALQQMGMISINHGERARVTAVTPDTLFESLRIAARRLLSADPAMLDHLKEARLMFEQAMVRIAGKRANAADRQRLQELIAGMTASISDRERFIQADMAFHGAIASISGNPLFAAISKAMLDWLTHFSVPTVHQPGAQKLTIAEHTAVLNCITAHDEAGAAQAMSDHLTRVNDLYRSLYRRNAAKRPVRR